MTLMRSLLAGIAMLTAAVAGAVGVSNDGAYKTFTGEREPAEPSANVRIVPPPPGGNLRVSIHTDRPRYHIGDQIQVFFGVNRDSYVYIFSTDASGITHQIFPNYYDPINFLRAGKTYYIPDRGYDLEITGPAGNEEIVIVAVQEDFPFLEEYRRYSRKDPYPSYRDGAAGLVRRIESFRREPSALEIRPIRPVPKESWWASESTSIYVMGRERIPAPQYKVPKYGRLDVDTYPSNARIYVDGEYYGRSPQAIDRLEMGYHRVHLEKEGYLPYECHVYIKANDVKDLDIFLKQTPIEPGYSKTERPSDHGGIGFFQPAP